MEKLETILRMLLVGLMVLRLTQVLLLDRETTNSGTVNGHTGVEKFFGSRLIDLFYWLNACISVRTAIWTAYGFTAVCFAWIACFGLSCLLKRTDGEAKSMFPDLYARKAREGRRQGNLSYVALEERMQTNRG